MRLDRQRLNIDSVEDHVSGEQRPARELDAAALCNDIHSRRAISKLCEADRPVQKRAGCTIDIELADAALDASTHDPLQCGFEGEHPDCDDDHRRNGNENDSDLTHCCFQVSASVNAARVRSVKHEAYHWPHTGRLCLLVVLGATKLRVRGGPYCR